MDVTQTVDGRHVAAAEDIALHHAAVHVQVDAAVLGAALGIQRTHHAVKQDMVARDVLVEAHVGVHAASNDVALHHAALDAHVGVVVRGQQAAHMLVVGVVVLARVGVVEGRVLIVALAVVAVVVAVRATHQVAYNDDIVVEVHIGAVAHADAGITDGVAAGVHLPARRAHVAAHVVAAVHIAEHAALQHHTARTPHVGHAAAAEDVVALDPRILGRVDNGTDIGGPGHVAVGVLHGLVHDGHKLRQRQAATVDHVASVAAAIDAAHAARRQLDDRQGLHLGFVVAAEEASYVVVAQFTRPALGAEVFVRT